MGVGAGEDAVGAGAAGADAGEVAQGRDHEEAGYVRHAEGAEARTHFGRGDVGAEVGTGQHLEVEWVHPVAEEGVDDGGVQVEVLVQEN